MNPYEILGVEKGATKEQINKAYRKKAQRAHPDRNGGDDTKMRELNRARDILLDPVKLLKWERGESPNPTPPIEVSAKSLIHQTFMQVIGLLMNQGTKVNPVNAARKMIEQERAKASRSISDLKQQIEKLESLRPDVTSETSENIYHDLIGYLSAQLKDQMETQEAKREIAIKAIELLKAYKSSIQEGQGQWTRRPSSEIGAIAALLQGMK